MYGRGYGSPQISFGPPVTPNVIKYLLIANLGVYILQLASQGWLFDACAVRPAAFWMGGYIWQPFTYMWLHSERSFLHIAINMLMLWMFGSQVAMAWGTKRFLQFYVFCGVGAGLVIASWPFITYSLGITGTLELAIPTVGASGAVYAVLLAYSLIWPDRTIMMIFPPVAFRAIWLIPITFGITFLFGGAGISHIGHLGGVLFGWLYLRRSGQAGSATLSLRQLRNRWHRYRMRRKLRAVRHEEFQRRRRPDDDDDRRGGWPLH